MGKNWAITIGINQYHNLQTLNFAQKDAEAMRDFFLDEINFDRVYHFTNESDPIEPVSGPPIASQSTFGTLRRFLRSRFEQPFLEAGDNFWFFFAGHGRRHEDRDYLMPIDGDPGDVEDTAIPIHYVTERLRRCGADNVIMLMDACRSQGRRSGLGIGSELQQGVISLFSCSPKESSYEIEELQQGAFTSALLQGLRLQGEGNCATVERLYQYLRVQVPALTQRYKKLSQMPYGIVEPPSKYHLILLPKQANVHDVNVLKKDALGAEVKHDLQLAEQYWIRVLAISPADSEAIEGIERLARTPPAPQSPAPPEPASQGTASGRRATASSSAKPTISLSPKQTSPPSAKPRSPSQRTSTPITRPTSSPKKQRQIVSPNPPSRLTRRRILQVARGIMGGAIALSWVVSRLSSNNSSKDWGEEVATNFSFNVVTVDAQGNETERNQGEAKGFVQPLGDDIELEMVSIPGGRFVMGSPKDEEGRNWYQIFNEKSTNVEGPQHQVTVPDFFMDKYLVTQAQWKAVAALPQIERELNPDPSNFKGYNRPVEMVSWLDATEFCKRLSKKTGREYRLPSEAEWEYACRAGTTTPFHFGETITTDLVNYRGTDNERYGWPGSYGDGPKGKYREETTPVGHFKAANAFGLYDIHGNLWEWCADHWHDSYEGAPTDGSAWITERDDSLLLLRGGSWLFIPRDCRSACRIKGYAGLRDYDTGFRVVCSAARLS